MTDSFVVKQKQFTPTDPRLGRHVRHDSRSLMFQVIAQDVSTLQSVRHNRYIPTLDQGPVGSCTGNAATGCLGTAMFWNEQEVKNVLNPTDAQVDETYAVSVYSEATQLDPFPGVYPPTDTGSDGLTVAKVLQGRGLISGYQHATSLEAVLTALASKPVIVGTEWRTNMFEPQEDGKLDINGNVEGGHEYVLDEVDVANKRVWMHNSWGDSWGIEGRAYFTWDDFGKLMAADGDCTVFTPVSQPAPPPTPVPVPDQKAEFISAATEWSSEHFHTANNREFAAKVKDFLSWYAQA